MKKVLFFTLFLLILGTAIVHAQVKIGDNTAPRTGAVLDLKTSYVGGLLLPNVNIVDTGKIDFTPATLWNVDSNHDLTGLIVYNTNEAIGKGVYVWDGETWLSVGLGGGGGGPVNPGCGELTIDSQTPASATINASAGDVVTLSVTATISDGTTPAFQWYQNSVAGTTGATKITGTTSGNTSSLTVPTVAGTNLYYYCTITSPCDLSGYLTRNWVVAVANAAPGSTWLGKSTTCAWNNKQACTCAVGTPIFYNDATTAQRDAARSYYPDSSPVWFESASNTDYWVEFWQGTHWTRAYGNTVPHSAACF